MDNSRFPDPKRKSSDAKLKWRASQGMRGGREAPDDDGNGVRNLRADGFDDRAIEHLPNGVGGLERGHDVPVVGVGPVESFRKVRLEQPENLPVHVIDERGQKEQRDDNPGITAFVGGGLRFRLQVHGWDGGLDSQRVGRASQKELDRLKCS